MFWCGGVLIKVINMQSCKSGFTQCESKLWPAVGSGSHPSHMWRSGRFANLILVIFAIMSSLKCLQPIFLCLLFHFLIGLVQEVTVSGKRVKFACQFPMWFYMVGITYLCNFLCLSKQKKE